ncbi:unnamed protein product [Owenia fusiformis]|uniref:Uncharacterized protein n=1 Tax=Owenia fusiformis TaxID=6347 RepID=A0A8J1THS7_OWEFU|nr:unnamed protein product [Owenia fusiformis]
MFDSLIPLELVFTTIIVGFISSCLALYCTTLDAVPFTGPFPRPAINESKRRGHKECRLNEKDQRVADFVRFISEKVDIRRKYIHNELVKHTDYIENLVQSICGKVCEFNRAFRIKEIVRRGSFYDRTKIVEPNEYDLMAILLISDSSAIDVFLNENCHYKDEGWGYGLIKLVKSDLTLPIPKDCMIKTSHAVHAAGESWQLSYVIMYKLREAVEWALKEMKDVKLLTGNEFTFHKDDPKNPYQLGDVSLHWDLHGPSVWLRVGAPLCTTDIDLCFCIERKNPVKITRNIQNYEDNTKRPQMDTQISTVTHTKLGRCAMIRGDTYQCDKCIEDHWVESVIDPLKNKCAWTDSHRSLLLTFKMISEFMRKRYKYVDFFPSYYLKVLLVEHENKCNDETNVGKCFYDIVNRFKANDLGLEDLETIDEVFENEDDANTDEFTIQLETGKFPRVKPIPDMHYPKRKIFGKLHGAIALIWFLQYVKHTPNTEWWAKLTGSEFGVQENEPFKSLTETFERVNTWTTSFRTGDLYLHNGSRLELKWQHDDGTDTYVCVTQ